jgi:hypothetical protein
MSAGPRNLFEWQPDLAGVIIRFDTSWGVPAMPNGKLIPAIPIVLLLALTFLFLLWSREGPAPAQNSRPMTREQFHALVIGKTADEVIKAVGPPDSRWSPDDGSFELWQYRQRTSNDRMIDPFYMIRFVNGKVENARAGGEATWRH